MPNLYTVPLWQTMASCKADFRFFENSLRNHCPAWMDPTVAVAQIGDLAGLNDLDSNLRPSFCDNLPAVALEDDSAFFGFPTNLEDLLAEIAEWSVEYVGRFQKRDNDTTFATQPHALIGNDTFSLNPSMGLVESAGDYRLYANFGAYQESAGDQQYFPDSLMHLVFTRGDGAGGVTYGYLNGLVGLNGVNAGQDGFFNLTGWIFNCLYSGDPAALAPFWGHHYQLRFYNRQLSRQEVYQLYKEAQRMFGKNQFPPQIT